MVNNTAMNLSKYLSEIESAKSLALRLSIPDALLSQWRNGVRQVPAERCPDIEMATSGAVTCEELRPDLAEKWQFIRSTSSVSP